MSVIQLIAGCWDQALESMKQRKSSAKALQQQPKKEQKNMNILNGSAKKKKEYKNMLCSRVCIESYFSRKIDLIYM